MGRRAGPSGIDAVFETAHDGGVPNLVKIFCSSIRIDRHAITAAVRVVRGVERLMDVADKVDQERQITGSAPAVVFALFQALRIFIDFPCHAVSAGASCRNVRSLVLQTNVDEVPWPRQRIFIAELDIRTDRSEEHTSE